MFVKWMLLCLCILSLSCKENLIAPQPIPTRGSLLIDVAIIYDKVDFENTKHKVQYGEFCMILANGNPWILLPNGYEAIGVVSEGTQLIAHYWVTDSIKATGYVETRQVEKVVIVVYEIVWTL